jgi:hypothetical protein
MDELALLLKGGEGGTAFVSGKSAESDMIKRCLLEESDDDHMPPKGKPQLTTSRLHCWPGGSIRERLLIKK